MDPTLLASISRLETSDVGEALQAVLRQAETVLRPASKYPRPRQSKLPSTPSIDKKAFARSMLALLQHASTLSATESALHGELVSLLATAMQQQPWLWEFFVKRHLSDLLSQPGAAALLSDSVCRLHPATQARNWSVLCGELRTMPLIGINDALAIAAFQRAALSQVRCCFRLITHDLPSSVAPGATAPAAAAVYRGHATGYATRENGISSNAQVHVTLTQYLPAALQVLIMQRGGSYHPYGSGNDIVKAAADASGAGGGARRQQQASECTAGSSAHSGAWVGEGEQDKGFAYAATLVEQMCSPELLAQLLNLGNLESSDRIGSTVPRPSVGTSLQSIETRVPGGSLGGARTRNEEADEGGAAAAGNGNRLTEDAVQRIHAAMMIVPVLVEALLTIPDVARRASRPPAVAISTLLAVRWELAQLLAAAGSGKMTATKSTPAPWSLQTATALLEATLVHADGVAGPSIQQQSNVLVMPPAVVSHALEIVKAALPRWSEFKNVAPDGGIHKDAIHFLDVMLRLQSACFCGVFQPHISVRSGPANQEAMLAAHRLHVLLVSDSSSDGGSRGAGTTMKKTLLSHGAERAAGNTKQRKRHSSSSSRHTEKQQQGAVAAFLELLARPQTAEPNNMRGDVDVLEKLQEAAAPGASPEDESVKNNAGGASPHQPPPRKRRIVAEQIGDLARAPDPQAASDEAEATATLIAAFSDAGNEASVGGATAAGDDASNAATAGQQAPTLMEEGDQVPGAESLAAGGRVVMTSTLLMDDAAREAMWKAYIQDKERMVEMLGDSSYREYYDEAAHPTPAVAPKTGNIDAAFDAVFGEARQVVTASYSGDTAPTLPQTILETSLLYPWQAALAAALQVLTWIVRTSEALSFTVADLVLGKLATAEQRKGAAAAALKALEPNHSRNTWLGVQRAAEVHLAAGNALFVVSSLRTLLQRTSRRTAPPTLAAFVSLARALLPRAQLEEAQDGDAMAGTSNKSTLLPLRFVGPLVRGFSRFPPLLAASLNAESAAALPVLAAAGCISSRGGGGGSVDTLPYLAGLLWLALAAEDSPTPPRPHWLVDQGAELTAHPLVAAAPVCRTAAVKELLPLVLAAAKALNSSCLGDDQQRQSQRRGEHQRDEFDVHAALPALDACAALLGYIHCRWNEQPSAPGNDHHRPLADTKRACATDPTRSAGPKHVERASALLEIGALIGSASTSRLCLGPEGVLQAMHLTAALCTWCNAASEGLAALLDGADASALSQGTLDDIEARAEVLTVGLELTDVARAALEGPLAATMVINGLPNEHQTAFCELTTVVESCDAALASALEILRTLGEDSAGYVVALRGMDAAPQLALLPLAVAVTAPEQGDQDPQQGPIARPDHQEGSEEAKVDLSAQAGHGTSRRSAYQRRRRLQDIRNPYLRAIVAESRRDAGDVADGDLSDLEDFIVANPERDYGEFISSHFPMAVDSDEDEDEDDADKDAGGDGDVDGDEVKQGE